MGEKSNDIKLSGEAPESSRTATGSVVIYNHPERIEPSQSGDRDLEAIRAEIERTRAEMSKTVNAIQDRLSPERLKAQAIDRVREATVGGAKDMANSANRLVRELPSWMVESVRDNPLPALLAGVGVGWLLVQSMRRSMESEDRHSDDRGRYVREEYRYFPEGEYTVEGEEYAPGSVHYQSPYHRGGYDEVETYGYGTQETTQESMEGVREAAQAGRERAEHYMSDAREGVNEARERAGQYTSQAKETFSRYSDEAREKAGQYSSQAREAINRYTDEARGKAARYARQTREMAGHYTEQVQHQIGRAKSGFFEMLEQNPLAIATAALIIGAVTGFSIPETRREEELMGETRDDLLHRARESGKETLEKVKRVAEEAQRAAVEEADKQNLTGHAAAEKVEEVASKAEDVANKATVAAQKEAKDQGLT